jgi:uncharacterized membrane protein (UPF0182 family)
MSDIQSLKDTQTESGYYTYRNASLSQYEIEGKKQLVYVAPREIEIDPFGHGKQPSPYVVP